MCNTIGSAIIVKNADSSISKTIKSIIPISSQIIVIDTGSTDSTAQICSKMGAEVHFLKWNNDFAEARNYALSLMRTDWILSIDADEVLEKTDFLRYKSIFNDKNIGGIKVKIKNFLSNDLTEYSVHSYTRIFRNYPQIKYQGKVHEQISDSIIQMELQIIDSDITIMHYGYIYHTEERISRNKLLLEQELTQNPNDDWLIYHLAETEFANSEYEKAFDNFNKIFDSNYLSLEQREIIRLRLAQISLKSNNIDKIKNYLNFKSNDDSKEGLRLFILLNTLLIKKEYDKANLLFKDEKIRNSNLINKEAINNTDKIFKILFPK